jgi:hypothetical protein
MSDGSFDLTKPFIAMCGYEYLVNPLPDPIYNVRVSSSGLDSGASTSVIAKEYESVPSGGYVVFSESSPFEFDDMVASWDVYYESSSGAKERLYFVAGKRLWDCACVRYVPFVGRAGSVVPLGGGPFLTTRGPSVAERWTQAFAKLPMSVRTAVAFGAEESREEERQYLLLHRRARLRGVINPGPEPLKAERVRIGYADQQGTIWGIVSVGTDGEPTNDLLTKYYAASEDAAALVLGGDIRELRADHKEVRRAGLSTLTGEPPQLYPSSAALFADHDYATDEAFLWDGQRWTTSRDPASWRDEANRQLSDDEYKERSSRFVQIANRASLVYAKRSKKKTPSLKKKGSSKD